MKKVVNYMEIWVDNKLEDMLKDTNGCKCDQCKSDIMAIALNNLKPEYCTTYKGEVISKLKNTDLQQEATVMIELTNAIKIVQNNPNHDIEEKNL